jgi:hypothetical protein
MMAPAPLIERWNLPFWLLLTVYAIPIIAAAAGAMRRVDDGDRRGFATSITRSA